MVNISKMFSWKPTLSTESLLGQYWLKNPWLMVFQGSNFKVELCVCKQRSVRMFTFHAAIQSSTICSLIFQFVKRCKSFITACRKRCSLFDHDDEMQFSYESFVKVFKQMQISSHSVQIKETENMNENQLLYAVCIQPHS